MLVLCLLQKDPPRCGYCASWDLASMPDTLYSTNLWTTRQDLNELGQVFGESMGTGVCVCLWPSVWDCTLCVLEYGRSLCGLLKSACVYTALCERWWCSHGHKDLGSPLHYSREWRPSLPLHSQGICPQTFVLAPYLSTASLPTLSLFGMCGVRACVWGGEGYGCTYIYVYTCIVCLLVCMCGCTFTINWAGNSIY